MKKEIITSAKTVEEAVALAVAELGAPSADAIEYTVIEEPKKGLFGIGAVDAKISATYTVGGEVNALEFIKKLLSDMNIEAEVEMTDGESGEKRISISGESAAILIGHHGDTLDSLQYLANLAANKRIDGKKGDYVKITVDVEGYRAKRESALISLAKRTADKCVKKGHKISLEPMDSAQRKIIHSALTDDERVFTRSEGHEPNRKVIVFPVRRRK